VRLNHRMVDPGRIRLHDPGRELEDLSAVSRGGSPDRLPRTFPIPIRGGQAVVEDPAFLPERRDPHVEVVARVEVAHDDPVRDTTGGGLATIAEERDDVRRPIQTDILDEISEGDGIDLACEHGRRPGTDRDRQGKISDPRKEIHDDVPRTNPIRDGHALPQVPRREHDARDVELVTDAALPMDRLGGPSPEDSDAWGAQPTVDPGPGLHPRPPPRTVAGASGA